MPMPDSSLRRERTIEASASAEADAGLSVRPAFIFVTGHRFPLAVVTVGWVCSETHAKLEARNCDHVLGHVERRVGDHLQPRREAGVRRQLRAPIDFEAILRPRGEAGDGRAECVRERLRPDQAQRDLAANVHRIEIGDPARHGVPRQGRSDTAPACRVERVAPEQHGAIDLLFAIDPESTARRVRQRGGVERALVRIEEVDVQMAEAAIGLGPAVAELRAVEELRFRQHLGPVRSVLRIRVHVVHGQDGIGPQQGRRLPTSRDAEPDGRVWNRFVERKRARGEGRSGILEAREVVDGPAAPGCRSAP